jgi:predicted restriction endonuclease
VFSILEKRGFKILNTKYINAHNKINLICKKGHQIQTSWRSLKLNDFSCVECKYERMRGENHPRFKHGLSHKDRLDRNKSRIQHNEWKRNLLKIHNYKCYICGTSEKLVAHHKNGYNWDVENRYNLKNGVILCKYHHDSFHLKYGKGDNTEQQFLEFYENNQMYLL